MFIKTLRLKICESRVVRHHGVQVRAGPAQGAQAQAPQIFPQEDSDKGRRECPWVYFP